MKKHSPNSIMSWVSNKNTASTLATAALWLAIVIMLFLRLGSTLIGTQVLTGYDMLDSFAPWSALPTANDEHFGNRYVTDIIDSEIPLISEIRSRMALGTWPLQSNMYDGGAGAMIDPSMGLLTPTRFLWLFLPFAIAPGWVKLFEIAFAITFTYLFMRALGMGKFASSAGGFVYAFSGFIVAWSGWPQSTVVSFIPMLFWSVETFVQRRRWRNLIPVSLAVAFMLLGGFPVVTGHTFVVVALYCIIRCLGFESEPGMNSWGKRFQQLGKLVIALVVGVALSCIQLVPFAQNTLMGTSLEYRRGWSSIQDPPTSWLSTVLSVPPLGSAAPQDYAAYIGAVALMIASFGVLAFMRGGLPRGVGMLFIATSVFVIAFISFQNVFGWGQLINKLPLLANNPPGRLRAQLGMPAAVFVGLGIQWLLGISPAGQWRRFSRIRTGLAAPAVVMAGITVLLISLGLLIYEIRLDQFDQVNVWADFVLALIPMWITFIILLLAWGMRKGKHVFLGIAGVSVVIQAVGPTIYFWPMSEPNEIYPQAQALTFLSENVGHDQIATAGLAMRPNVPTIYGIRIANGHAFPSRSWMQALTRADKKAYVSGGTYSFLQPNRSTLFANPQLDLLGVRYVVASASEYNGVEGVPVPLPGEASDAETTSRTKLTSELSTSVSWTIHPDVSKLNGVVVPMWLEGGVRVQVVAFDSRGFVIAKNTLDFASPGTDIKLPVALALPPDAVVHSIRVDIQPQRGESSSSSVRLYQTDAGSFVAWSNTVSVQDAGSYPLVYAGDDVIIWERNSAYPRIRLSVDKSGRIPMGLGGTRIDINRDDGDVIDLDVDVSARGFVSVAQSLGNGYNAYVDGNRVPIIGGDSGVYSIPVEAGSHRVRIVFEPKSVLYGGVISAGGLGVLLIWALGGVVRDVVGLIIRGWCRQS